MIRHCAVLAALCAPCMSYADGVGAPVQVDLTRLVAHASGQDWNGDGLNDRLLLAINDAGDAVDLITFFSDAQTGRLRPADVIASVLPAEGLRAGNALFSVSYSGGRGGTDYQRPVLYSSGDDSLSYLAVTLRHDDGGWVLDHALSGSSARDCEMDYVADLGTADPFDDTEFAFDIRAAPPFDRYWWRDALPAFCQGGGG